MPPFCVCVCVCVCVCLLFGIAAQGEIYVGGRNAKKRLSALVQEHLGISVHTQTEVMFVSPADQ